MYDGYYIVYVMSCKYTKVLFKKDVVSILNPSKLKWNFTHFIVYKSKM